MKGTVVSILLLLLLVILPASAGELRVLAVPGSGAANAETHLVDGVLVAPDSGATNVETNLLDWVMEPTISSSNVGNRISRKESAWVCQDMQTGGIIPGAYFTFVPALGDDNGGHEHSTGRSFGTFTPVEGYSSQDTGRFVTTYQAPEAAGQMLVVATCRDPLGGSGYGTFRIHVAFQDAGGLFFSELPQSDYYSLEGETNTHPVNHFGTRVFVAQLQNVAMQYHAAFPQATLLSFNDISLKWGGVFDIASNWLPEHFTHRLGNNVDMRLIPVANRPVLVQIIRMQGLHIHPELARNHWHLY